MTEDFAEPVPPALDIIDVLDFWAGRDDVPEELSSYLSVAADEIRGLREENKYLHKMINDAEPRF